MDYPLWHGSIPMEVFIDSAPGESARQPGGVSGQLQVIQS